MIAAAAVDAGEAGISGGVLRIMLNGPSRVGLGVGQMFGREQRLVQLFGLAGQHNIAVGQIRQVFEGSSLCRSVCRDF